MVLWLSNLCRMRDQKFHRLPSLLVSLRQAQGMSQKAASLGCGISQPVYCAIERGRRGNLHPETIARIAKTLNLDSATHTRLVWEVEHDRLIDQVLSGPAAVAAPLVAAALTAAARLLPEEAEGLAKYIDDLIAARQKLESVTTRVRVTSRKEAAMS